MTNVHAGLIVFLVSEGLTEKERKNMHSIATLFTRTENTNRIETALTVAVCDAERALESANKRGLSEATCAKYSRAYWAARDNCEAFYAGLQGRSAPNGECWAYFKGQESRGEMLHPHNKHTYSLTF